MLSIDEGLNRRIAIYDYINGKWIFLPLGGLRALKKGNVFFLMQKDWKIEITKHGESLCFCTDIDFSPNHRTFQYTSLRDAYETNILPKEISELIGDDIYTLFR